VVGESTSPGGKMPVCTAQVNGATPPDEPKEARYGTLAEAAGKAVVVMNSCAYVAILSERTLD
jgi:hypothetical protein